MKTLVNKNNPQIRITAPEIERRKAMFYQDEHYCLIIKGLPWLDADDWTLVEEEQKPILEVFGFKVGDAVRLKDGDGRKHIIKSFKEVEGIHGPNFYQVEFEDNSARDGIYPGEEYPNGYYTQMEKFKEEPEKITKYLRFGGIPENGKSKIWRGEDCVGEEEGVSVYEIRFDKENHISICLPFPFHRDTLDTLTTLTKYDNRPCYIVTGEYVGKGTDGEPIISNVQIEEEFPKIIPDEKMEQMGEEISKAAVDNINEQFNKIVEEEPEFEHRRKDTIYFLETAKKHYADTSEIELTIDWLKSLRPKPKQDWIKEQTKNQ